MTTAKPQNVYQMIAAVAGEMAAHGIGKDKRNTQQGYNFRGIDDVYNALAPVMARVGLVIIPRVLSRECVERQSAKGNPLFYVSVDCEYDFVSSQDGSAHTARTWGEAMDSADKATNKAMSAAYKYAMFQTFCIPTEGDNDADATTHEVAPKVATKPKPVAKPQPDDVPDSYRTAIEAAAAESSAALVDMLGTIDAEDNEFRRRNALKLWAKAVADNCVSEDIARAGKAVRAWPNQRDMRGSLLATLGSAYKAASKRVEA